MNLKNVHLPIPMLSHSFDSCSCLGLSTKPPPPTFYTPPQEAKRNVHNSKGQRRGWSSSRSSSQQGYNLADEFWVNSIMMLIRRVDVRGRQDRYAN